MQSVETDDPSPAALDACSSSIQIVKRITTIAANNAQVVCTHSLSQKRCSHYECAGSLLLLCFIRWALLASPAILQLYSTWKGIFEHSREKQQNETIKSSTTAIGSKKVEFLDTKHQIDWYFCTLFIMAENVKNRSAVDFYDHPQHSVRRIKVCAA